MDFVKKNLGLLICALVCLLAAAFLTVQIIGAKKKLLKQEKFVAEQKTFFDRAGQERYKLKPEKGQELENIVQAQKNFAKVDEMYKQGCKFLGDKFSFSNAIILPTSSPEALKQISDQIRSMTEFIIKNEIDFSGIAKEYTQIVSKGSINPAEFKPLFRQLYIYRHLLENVAAAGISRIGNLDWLMGFQVREEDIYTVTPIYLTFTADLQTTQKFLNLMSNDEKMLFYLKNVQITAPDTYTQVMLNVKKSQSENRSFNTALGDDGPAGEGMLNAPFPGQQRSSRRADRPPLEEGGEGAEMRTRSADQSRFVKPEPRRQDYLVFHEKIATVVARFDLYEFKKPEAQ